ncbi:MAG: acyl-CoA dehydrogenase [Deltaproteobacteria bacterium]|nr:acyl-CoA dehydrogenase [Deltaproteobacteria bacterium]
MAARNFFKADLRELEFALLEQFQVEDLFGKAPYAAMTREDVKMILQEAHTFVSDVVGPTLQESDREGCQIAPNGKVTVPACLKPAWKAYFENGWNGLALPESRGGQSAPHLLDMAVLEMFTAANAAFAMYPGLTSGAAEVIARMGSPEQKKLFLPPMDTGRWAGTMLLTEAQAGSDVGLNAAKAVKNPDGSYSLTGTKIFISGGDQDLTENIIHLALARVEGAPKGTKGLSLFIVPKILVNPDGSLGAPNDVVCTGIEHKMGIHASATCTLSFGEKGKCVGYMVGGEPKAGVEPGAGMRKMFTMMNLARIGVGVQSLGVASTAYLNALEYARTRRQGAHLRKGRPPEGAVPIIQHPDVRRMLLEMKSQVEGCRALIYHAIRLQDQANIAAQTDPAKGEELLDYVGLFIPLVKAYVSDTALAVASTAMQVYGGAGYTRDYPAEQYMRDARIFPIYEGTNGIQAMDLVGRKLAQNGGALVGRFGEEAGSFAAKLKEQSAWNTEAGLLTRAVESYKKVVGDYMAFFTQDKMELIPLTGTRFLNLMAKIAIANLLLQGARLAEEKLAKTDPESRDGMFYRGKIASARFFTRNILPQAVAEAEIISSGDPTALDIPDGGFSTAW